MNILKKELSFKRAKRTQQQIYDFIKTRFSNEIIDNLTIEDDNFSFTIYSKLPYENLVNQLIAERYTIQDELAIQRKHSKGVNEDEFNEYYEFVEQCKVRAKEFIAERERVTNG